MNEGRVLREKRCLRVLRSTGGSISAVLPPPLESTSSSRLPGQKLTGTATERRTGAGPGAPARSRRLRGPVVGPAHGNTSVPAHRRRFRPGSSLIFGFLKPHRPLSMLARTGTAAFRNRTRCPEPGSASLVAPRGSGHIEQLGSPRPDRAGRVRSTGQKNV